MLLDIKVTGLSLVLYPGLGWACRSCPPLDAVMLCSPTAAGAPGGTPALRLSCST